MARSGVTAARPAVARRTARAKRETTKEDMEARRRVIDARIPGEGRFERGRKQLTGNTQGGSEELRGNESQRCGSRLNLESSLREVCFRWFAVGAALRRDNKRELRLRRKQLAGGVAHR